MKWNVPAIWKQLWQRYKYVLLVILAGVILLLLPAGGSNGADQSDQREQQAEFDMENLERKLEELLSRIHHAGQVDVMLSVKESRRRVLAYDTERTGDHTQYDTVIVSQGSGVQRPVVLHEICPTFRGALIVCEGGDDPTVKLQIMEAVKAVTGLSADRISVCKGT